MPIADTSVRTYLSTMTGAPTLSGTAGALITLLDNCLINGFGSVTLSSLVVSSNVATATVNTGHGFSMIGGSGGVGPVSTLNRDWRIASVPNSTTFTFVTADISDQTATGTITAKIAPADWEKRYSATNKAVYARTDEDATAMLLRVDDTGTTTAQVRGYEEMTDIDSGAGLFPTIAQVAAASALWQKSDAATSAARGWAIFADSKRMYFFPQWTTGTYRDFEAFGDPISYKPGDTCHCTIVFHSGANGAYLYNSALFVGYTEFPMYCARGVAQIGSAVSIKATSGWLLGIAGASGVAYPNAANNALLLRGEVELTEIVGGTVRARWPGIYIPMHALPLIDGDVVGGINGNQWVMAIRVYTSRNAYNIGGCAGEGRIFINLTDWS